jgi:hypothetical protein
MHIVTSQHGMLTLAELSQLQASRFSSSCCRQPLQAWWEQQKLPPALVHPPSILQLGEAAAAAASGQGCLPLVL